MANESLKNGGNGSTPNWQNILWREWRNCDDAEYARHLFELLINEPADRRVFVILGVLGALSGALAGGWLGLWFNGGEAARIGINILLGAVIGGLAALGPSLGRKQHWEVWLQRLLPHPLLVDSIPDEPATKRISPPAAFLNLLHFRLPAALISSLGVSVTGILFFDQNELSFLFAVGIIGAIVVGGFCYAGMSWLLRLLLSVLLGLAFGLFFGLGFAQIFGQLIGPFDVAGSTRWVGLGVGIGAGLFFGRGAGLLSTLIWQSILAGVAFFDGVNLILLGWLAGFMLGSLLGSLSRVWGFSNDRLTFIEAYACRVWYWWWPSRPFAAQVEAGLRQHAAGPLWSEAFRCLDEQLSHREAGEVTSVNGKKSSSRQPKKPQHEPVSAEALWASLRQPDWIDRFVGCHALAGLGGEAIPHLLANVGTHPLRRTASWLTRSIGYETTQRLASHANNLLCPICLTRCGSHPLKRPGLSITYYGCRICGQSRYFLACPQGVVAMLDNTWMEEHSYRDGLLQINWLARRNLFDFDRIEIVQATDEEVERFAVQVGNDTDPVRQLRYRQIPFFMAAESHVSENTRRIMEHTFADAGELGKDRV